MIEFVKSEGRFLDTVRGDSIQVTRDHPKDEFYHVHYRQGEEERRFGIKARLNKTGDIDIIFYSSEAFFQQRRAWLNYGGSPTHLTNMELLLKAWAVRQLPALPISRIIITDARSSSVPSITAAGGAPTTSALENLRSAYLARRNDR